MQGTIAGLGAIFQMAFVPRDFGAAVDFWTGTVGAGPFFLSPRMTFDAARFRGGPPTRMEMTVALGYWQDMQIELFDLHDEGPSTYHAYRDSGQSGVHHVAIQVEDKWAAAQRVEEMGGVLEQELSPENALYYQIPGMGAVLELVQLAPPWRAAFDEMRQAARLWDGTNPLRPFPGT